MPAREFGLKVKSRSPFKCVVYNVNVSSPSPFLKTNIGMCSYLDHICPVWFAFIQLHHILGTISRGGATGHNLGHLCNSEFHKQFSVSLYHDIHSIVNNHT